MIYILLFLSVLFSVLLVAFATTANKPKQISMAERLKTAMAVGPTAMVRDEEKMKKSLLDRVIIPISGKLSKYLGKLMPTGMVASTQRYVTEAGFDDKISGSQVTTMSYMLMVGLPIFIFLLFFPSYAQGKVQAWHMFAACGISGILGFRLPIGIVISRAKKRKHEIQKSLPFTFDLISISVEAGMAFDGAMATVAERTKGPLAVELQRTLREINLGISRYDALNNLGNRTGVEDLKSFLTAVNYITRLGGSLVEVIRIQTEAMRVKRRQRAEKLAAQAPVKIMIPLVLFILPCIFIVVLGPPAMQALKQMSTLL